MEVNTGKSHPLHSGNVRATAKIGNNYIESKKEQVLLGITIDSNLTFENHINNICKRASQKLNALARVAPYMNMQKRRIIMKSFVTSQFGYCPLIWMFHSRRLNNKINSIHERALRITYQDRCPDKCPLKNYPPPPEINPPRKLPPGKMPSRKIAPPGKLFH